MRYSDLLGKARKAETSEESVNADLLIRGGFIRKEMAGIYTMLPLGLRVLHKINSTIRLRMNEIGVQEVHMPQLSSIEAWKKTQREKMNILFKLTSRSGQELALVPTSEEVVTPLMKEFIASYRDLPVAIFQIQSKFRDELRAKSGILRGREFMMKDAYSFHRDEADLDAFYDQATAQYHKIFADLGIGDQTLLTYASGGDFTQYSHEFQTLSPVGEDTIFVCNACHIGINSEIMDQQKCCPKCSGTEFSQEKGIEVGNIFKLRNRFSKAFDLTYKNERGEDAEVEMGCYGIGPTRVMGTIVEVHHDDRGIKWPKSIAPFQRHLIALGKQGSEALATAEKLYDSLKQRGEEVLFDDRITASTGEKMATADLIGVPQRLVVSDRSMKSGGVEVKERAESNATIVPLENV